VDAADVLHRARDLALQSDALVGVPGVGVAVGDDDVAVRERGFDDAGEVVGVVGGEQEQFGERVGVGLRLGAPDGLAVPRVRRLAREREAVAAGVPERLPDRRLPATVDALQGDEHTPETDSDVQTASGIHRPPDELGQTLWWVRDNGSTDGRPPLHPE
jgi:hypothetical protein